MHNMTWLYIFVMIATTYMVRTLPLTMIRGKFSSPFLRSFLYYVPYVTLTVMTFPAILNVTNNIAAGAFALAAALIAAFKGLGLFQVSLICCIVVLIFSCLAI